MANKTEKVEKKIKENFNKDSLTNKKRLAIMAVDEKSSLLKEGHRKFLKEVKKGKTLRDAAVSAGYNERHGTKLVNKLVKYSLKNEKLVKKAYKVIEDLASNKPKLKKIKSDGTKVYVYPTHGHQLKAAEMVYDRYEPTIKSPLIQLNQQLSPIDLSKYKLVPKDDEDDGVVVIDVEQG